MCCVFIVLSSLSVCLGLCKCPPICFSFCFSFLQPCRLSAITWLTAIHTALNPQPGTRFAEVRLILPTHSPTPAHFCRGQVQPGTRTAPPTDSILLLHMQPPHSLTHSPHTRFCTRPHTAAHRAPTQLVILHRCAVDVRCPAKTKGKKKKKRKKKLCCELIFLSVCVMCVVYCTLLSLCLC